MNWDELIDMYLVDDPAVRSPLRDVLEELFASKPLEQWMHELGDETMTGFVNTPAEAVNHPQIEARGIVEYPDDTPPRVGFPALNSDDIDRTDERLPGHGEHIEEVLRDAGVSLERIATFRDAGVID